MKIMRRFGWYFSSYGITPLLSYARGLYTLKHELSTVKFLLQFQVEHPCTEMIADINLPAAQLQVSLISLVLKLMAVEVVMLGVVFVTAVVFLV